MCWFLVGFLPGLLFTYGQGVPHQLLDLDFKHVYPSVFFFNLNDKVIKVPFKVLCQYACLLMLKTYGGRTTNLTWFILTITIWTTINNDQAQFIQVVLSFFTGSKIGLKPNQIPFLRPKKHCARAGMATMFVRGPRCVIMCITRTGF